MAYRMQITIDGTVYPVYRDAARTHPVAVHDALGTSSEAELQRVLDTLNVSDWYDADGQQMASTVGRMRTAWKCLSARLNKVKGRRRYDHPVPERRLRCPSREIWQN